MITTFVQKYIVLFIGGLGFAVILLFVLCLILFSKIRRERKRYDFFMGANRRPTHNLETKLQEYYENTKAIDAKYTDLLNMVTDMDKTMKSNVQKVGLIRYNPFEEMGGNLCFALALLDGEDNGVVLNGIHSRTGSFTYAKPIEMGVSIYMLSEEEKQAVKMAQEQAYQPKHEKVVKVKFKPLFKRRYAPDMQELIAKQQQQKMASVGDVTTDEKQQIEKEETVVAQIAATDMTEQSETLLEQIQEETADFFAYNEQATNVDNLEEQTVEK